MILLKAINSSRVWLLKRLKNLPSDIDLGSEKTLGPPGNLCITCRNPKRKSKKCENPQLFSRNLTKSYQPAHLPLLLTKLFLGTQAQSQRGLRHGCRKKKSKLRSRRGKILSKRKNCRPLDHRLLSITQGPQTRRSKVCLNISRRFWRPKKGRLKKLKCSCCRVKNKS